MQGILKFFSLQKPKSGNFVSSKEQKIVTYILKTKEEYDAFVAGAGQEMFSAIRVSRKLLETRQSGAYTDVLRREVYGIESDWNTATSCVRRCIENLPAVHDDLDKTYHLEALSSPKNSADVFRIKCKDVVEHLEKIAEMLSHFQEHKELSTKCEKEVIPELFRLRNGEIS